MLSRRLLLAAFGPCLLLGALAAARPARAECASGFIRGDSNVDGDVDISDGSYTLNYLFLGGPPPRCFDAADANDAAGLDVSDPVYTFQFLFNNGRPLPPPGPNACGLDPTDDALDCESYSRCPNEKQCDSDDCCDPGFFCRKGTGDCDGLGDCFEKPTGGCPEIFAPVCGCDGETYGNECEAFAAGVNILHEGECRVTLPCESNLDCPQATFCLKESGDCDGRGVCSDIPPACPAVFDPVCGCDGRTYGNGCDAHSNGVNVLHEGECELGLECRTNADCPDTAFCEKRDDDCDGVGLCTPRPLGCPDVFDPVCGCDGRTHSNRCDANAVGVSVRHEGECELGFECKSNDDCPDDLFCGKRDGDCDGLGQCLSRPGGCPRIFDPVCGCDGVTYSNDCVAAAAGVTLAHRGECEQVFRCTGDDECNPQDYCAKDIGDCDGAGVCTTKPTACPDNVAPVCGCDGVTYGNSCEAAAAGVNIAVSGECGVACSSNTDCDDAEFCLRREGDCDGVGTCAVRQTICPLVFMPVCGCDGVTYSNACFASGAGVSVLHDGPCEEN